MTAGAVILAAGGATRFGGRKQLLEIQGVTLLDRACRTAKSAGCKPVLRVLGAGADEILQRGGDESVLTLVHEKWSDGMGSSLAAGVDALLTHEPDCRAIFIMLTDQPMVTPELLKRMFLALKPPFSMVLCDYGSGSGPPALFERRHFPALLELAGDCGAKALATNDPDSVMWLPFPDGIYDIDSHEAWRSLESKLASVGVTPDI